MLWLVIQFFEICIVPCFSLYCLAIYNNSYTMLFDLLYTSLAVTWIDYYYIFFFPFFISVLVLHHFVAFFFNIYLKQNKDLNLSTVKYVNLTFFTLIFISWVELFFFQNFWFWIDSSPVSEDLNFSLFALFNLKTLIPVISDFTLSDVTPHFVEFSLFNLNINNTFTFNYTIMFDEITYLFILLSVLIQYLIVLEGQDRILKQDLFLYYNLWIIISLLIFFIFTASDILFFYISFEAILIPMFWIILKWGSRNRKIRAAYLLFFYTIITALFMLIGILYLSKNGFSTNYFDLILTPLTFNEQLVLWCLFFLVFASKIPMLPFHIWLPEAHVEAPTSGSVLLAGILLKFGSYGFIRYVLGLFPFISNLVSPFIIMLSLLGIIYASFSAIRQIDIKRIIAYSSIAHMNLIVLGIFSFTTLGLIGSVFQSISHAFVASALFFLIGMLYNRYHSRIISYYGGLIQLMPTFSFLLLFFIMANIGFPGTSNFLGELALLASLIKTFFFITFFASTGLILGGLYSLFLCNRLLFGNLKYYLHYTSDLTSKELFIVGILAFFTLLFGLSPLTLDCYYYNYYYY